MTESKCNEFPQEGKIFVTEIGVLGKRKKIIYVDPKKDELDFEKPLTEKQFYETTELYDGYEFKVRRLSRENFKLGYNLNNTGYCVDHKISVYSCFLNNISIEDAAHISNLRIITREENHKKWKSNYRDIYNSWIFEKYGLTTNKNRTGYIRPR